MTVTDSLRLFVPALAGALLLGTSPALAQGDASPAHGDAEEQGEDIEEIIVSATYRDTRLMNTPLTISAVTAAEIVAKGIEDIQTLYQSIPGLAYRTNSQTYNTLSVRGLTPPSGGGGAMVGVYTDNLPMTDSNTGGLSQTLGALFDMERVEVLKGPQGTLYGEGNLGGSIRYITKKPDPSRFDYSFQTNVEDIGESDGLSYRADAMVNIPLGDRLAARLVAYRRDRVGILDQVAPRNEQDVDTFLEDGARVKVAWFPSDTIEISAMVNIINGDYGGPGLGYHCFTESTPSDPEGQFPEYDLPGTTCAGQFDQFGRDPYVTHLAHPTHKSGGWDDQAMYNFNVEWELGFANLTSSTSYFDRQTAYSEETSPRFSAGLRGLVNAAACFGAVPGCGPATLASLGGDGIFYRATERFVQELRLVSNTDGPWQWTVGGYYKDDESQGTRHSECHEGGSPLYDGIDTHCALQYSFYDGVPLATQQAIVLWLNTAIFPGTTNFRTFGEESLFGEVSYRFNEQWDVLVGARSARVQYDLDLAPAGSDSRDNPDRSLSTPSRFLSPKVTLTWRPRTDLMIYGTYSSGFRPGIINTGLATRIAELDAVRAGSPAAEQYYQNLNDLQEVDGDSVVNYELGIKATVADGRVSFVGSLYQLDWQDTIISVSDEIPDIPGVSPLPFDYNINGGTAESQGMDFEVRTVLTDNLRLNFGGDWNWEAVIGAAGQGRYGGVAIEPGNRLANAPEYSAYAALMYDFVLAGYNAQARLDGYVIAESWNTANNERPAPAYETFDAKLLLGRDDWQVGAYIRNLSDETVVYELNQVGYRFGRPRTFGVQLNYRL